MVWVLESFVLILREFGQMRNEREEKGEAAAFGGRQERRVWFRRSTTGKKGFRTVLQLTYTMCCLFCLVSLVFIFFSFLQKFIYIMNTTPWG